MISTYAQSKHKIQIMDKPPNWGDQLSTIYNYLINSEIKIYFKAQ